MNDLSELFWNASIDELQKGFLHVADQDCYICLVCGKRFEEGVIYPDSERWYEAKKYAGIHLEREHGSMFDYLLQFDKKVTGLTDLQKKLLQFFYQGLSDSEIVKKLDGGSTSTIRHHRFSLREKEKQAKIFLALMGMVEKRMERRPRFIPIPKTATMLDERYAITEEENAEILRTYFPEHLDGRLTEFPKKEKRKVAILRHILKRFEPERMYTEKEVNAILKAIFDDYVTLRRYLVDYGMMNRRDDGSAYWVHV